MLIERELEAFEDGVEVLSEIPRSSDPLECELITMGTALNCGKGIDVLGAAEGAPSTFGEALDFTVAFDSVSLGSLACCTVGDASFAGAEMTAAAGIGIGTFGILLELVTSLGVP